MLELCLLRVARRLLQCCFTLDLKGWLPKIVANTTSIATRLADVQRQQRYFQQVRPLADCDAEDGRVVGRLLVELVEGNLKDLAHAIRDFVYRTAMLRDCGLRHIGAMLVRVLSADSRCGPDDSAIVSRSPSSVTEKQAVAIGSAIASRVHRSHVPATALQNVVKSLVVLQAMNSDHAWFVPMLEVLTAHKAAEVRQATFMKLLMRLATNPDVTVVHVDTTHDEQRSFNSVVIAYLPILIPSVTSVCRPML